MSILLLLFKLTAIKTFFDCENLCAADTTNSEMPSQMDRISFALPSLMWFLMVVLTLRTVGHPNTMHGTRLPSLSLDEHQFQFLFLVACLVIRPNRHRNLDIFTFDIFFVDRRLMNISQ